MSPARYGTVQFPPCVGMKGGLRAQFSRVAAIKPLTAVSALARTDLS